jgi:hypothetical protein
MPQMPPIRRSGTPTRGQHDYFSLRIFTAMRQYSILHIPLLSFFSKSLYHDVGLRWKGTGFAYLLLLLASCWLFHMIEIHAGLRHFFDDQAPEIVLQVPDIHIVNGEALVDAEQPYHIVDPESGQSLAIIDTTGSITSLDQIDARALMTKHRLIVHKSDIETRTFDFTGIEELTVNRTIIDAWLGVAKRILMIAIYPLAVFGSFALRVIQALLYAGLGILLTKWRKVELPYLTLLRLTVTALTPVIIAKTALNLAEIHLPFAWVWYFLGAMAYLFLGILACTEQPPHSSHLTYQRGLGNTRAQRERLDP